MRALLLLVGLLLGVQVATANILSWLEGKDSVGDKHVDQPQADDPGAFSIETRVHTLLNAMKDSFSELATKRNSWYDRYDDLGNQATDQSAKMTELLTISRVAMPIIWTTFKASHMKGRYEALQKGKEVHYIPPDKDHGEYVPHPLRILPTTMTEKDDFSADVILKTNNEANVGIRLMFEPESGHDFNWDDDDIVFGVHLRWHFDWGNDREISLHDKYAGRFRTESEVISPETHWPHIKVGEKFGVNIQKRGNCYSVFVVTGKDLYGQEQFDFHYMHRFCPTTRRTSKMIQEPRKLYLVINEDKPHTGEVEVYALTWYPHNAV